MNAISTPVKPVNGDEAKVQEQFQTKMQAVVKKVNATASPDEVMLNLSDDICTLFQADRMSLFLVDADKKNISTKTRMGTNSFRDLKLPISDSSIAGYVAMHKRLVNIPDVYDDAALQKHSPQLKFLKEVDKRTGFRTKQILASPIIDSQKKELVGVLQIINYKLGPSAAFPKFMEDGIKTFSGALADSFTKPAESPSRGQPSKYAQLVTDGVMNQQDFEKAQAQARQKNVDIEEVLTGDFRISANAIGKALSKFYSTPYEPFKMDRQKPTSLLAKVKKDYAESSGWIPLYDNPKELVVLTTDPESVKSSRTVNNIFSKANVVYAVTTKKEFKLTLDKFYSGDAGGGSIVGSKGSSGGNDEVVGESDNEVVNFVNKLIVDAYEQGASDIHIEPGLGEDPVQIRVRKDGGLMVYKEVSPGWRNSMVSRLKIMCDLDISEKRKPQDGKIKFKKFYPTLDIELRVATIPSTGGNEDVVMRILASGEPLPLENLGILPKNLERLTSAIEKPYGLFFVCGPTGSGKTTTLHSILKHLNTTDTKIWTAEDPVEITQKGLRQVQINKKAGLDFATIMRSFLRADPDIIMVGEMRDKETTSIGIEASLTGHLVFATLHTNSAPESITRLLDMGMDPFNFADALLGILAQRLAKRLCSSCKETYTPAADEIKQMLMEYCEELLNTPPFKKDAAAAYKGIYTEWVQSHSQKGVFTLCRPKGCDACAGTGYKGRLGLHELMLGTDRAKKLIIEKAMVAQLLAASLEDGMRTLKMDGIEKVLQGNTDMKQVRAVCIK